MKKILDLGCGTGDLTHTLSQSGVEVFGIDKSVNMIREAQHKYPHIPFSVRDATSLNINNEFDAVFSNATLHWIQTPLEVLQTIYQSLKQGGRFVAEFGGKGNVQTITEEIIHQIKVAGLEFNEEKFLWYFPSIGEYTRLMEDVGFRVTFAQHFDRPTPLDGVDGLRNWMNMFGIHLFEGISEVQKNEIMTNVENNLKSTLYNDGQWIADYKRIRVVGIKE